MPAFYNAVHSGVRCMWQLQEPYMFAFSPPGMEFLQVLQFFPQDFN